MSNRNFTIDYSSTSHTNGRYSAEKPIEAAKKAAEKLFSESNSPEIRLCMRETTMDSRHRSYHYVASRKNNAIKVATDKYVKKGDPLKGRTFYLQDINGKYLTNIRNRNRDNCLKTDNINNATIWEAEASNDGSHTYYTINDGPSNEEDYHNYGYRNGNFLPGYRVLFHYDENKGYFRPVSNANKADNFRSIDDKTLKVRFVS